MIPEETIERTKIIVETYQKLKAQIEVDSYCVNNREKEEDKKAISDDMKYKEEQCKQLESEMMSIIVDLKKKGFTLAFLKI